MLVLLPYIIIGLGVSIGLCSAAGYTGALLVVMLVALFLAGFFGSLLVFVLILTVISLFVDTSKPQERPADERKKDFACMECPYTQEAASEEAARCLRCDCFGFGNLQGGRVEKW